MKATKLLIVLTAFSAMLSGSAMAQDRLASIHTTYNNRLASYDSVDDYFHDRGYTHPRPLPRREKALSFLLEVSPFGGLSSPDMEDFETTDSISGDTESIDGSGNYMPTIHMGLGINNPVIDIDMMVGGGVVSNDAFGASFAEIAIAPRFRFGPHFRMGPFISAMSFGDATWREDSDIDITGGSGSRVGMSMCVGHRKAFFKTTITYADFDFDVDDSTGDWTASSNSIDMSGWAMQMGVYFRF